MQCQCSVGSERAAASHAWLARATESSLSFRSGLLLLSPSYTHPYPCACGRNARLYVQYSPSWVVRSFVRLYIHPASSLSRVLVYLSSVRINPYLGNRVYIYIYIYIRVPSRYFPRARSALCVHAKLFHRVWFVPSPPCWRPVSLLRTRVGVLTCATRSATLLSLRTLMPLVYDQQVTAGAKDLLRICPLA